MKAQRQTIRSILSENTDPLPSIWKKCKPKETMPPHLGYSEIFANCPLTPDEVLSVVADALAGGCPGESQLEYRSSRVIEAHEYQPAKVSHEVRLYLTKDHPVTDTLLGVELSGDFAVTLPREILIDFHVVTPSKVIDDVSNEEREKSRAIGVLERIWGNHLNAHAPSVEMIEGRGLTPSFAWNRLIKILPLTDRQAADAISAIVAISTMEAPVGQDSEYNPSTDVLHTGKIYLPDGRCEHRIRVRCVRNDEYILEHYSKTHGYILDPDHRLFKRYPEFQDYILYVVVPSQEQWVQGEADRLRGLSDAELLELCKDPKYGPSFVAL